MRYSDVAAAAPTAPPCFDDRTQWVTYLASAQQGPVCSRPFINGRFKPTFSYCSDCSAQYMASMQAKGRCKPQALHERPIEATSQ